MKVPSMASKVSKWNGTGNDFILVSDSIAIDDRITFTKRVCDRKTGIENPTAGRCGGDGVLFLSLEDTSSAHVDMFHVQPDGSTPKMCGNGVRCAAKWGANRLETEIVVVETATGPHRATIDGWTVTVEMQAPSFVPSEVPITCDESLIEEYVNGLTVTAVNTGVPHAVAFVDEVMEVDLSTVAPPVRHADVFPEGVNVTLVSHTDNGEFTQRTYERGVEGETRACGTGAVAIAAAAIATGRASVGESLMVNQSRGKLRVSISNDKATLEGPVEREYQVSTSTLRDNYPSLLIDNE